MKEEFLLRILISTSFNYAITSPLVYIAFVSNFAKERLLLQAAVWFFVIFISPIGIALFRAKAIQKSFAKLTKEPLSYRLFGLKKISSIPTGWDWVFIKADPCFVIVTLIDGSVIAGFMGKDSLASSDLDHRDMFIEQVYTIPENGDPWVMVEGTLGIHVAGAQIAHIEFRS